MPINNAPPWLVNHLASSTPLIRHHVAYGSIFLRAFLLSCGEAAWRSASRFASGVALRSCRRRFSQSVLPHWFFLKKEIQGNRFRIHSREKNRAFLMHFESQKSDNFSFILCLPSFYALTGCQILRHHFLFSFFFERQPLFLTRYFRKNCP